MIDSNYKPQHFAWTVRDRVGIVTLNRPERKNPLTLESYAELRDFFRRLGPGTGDAPRAIVIRGAGGNFCSGGDVHDIIGPLVAMKNDGDMAGLLAFTRMTGDLVKAIKHCPLPVIAAIEGVCVGAGACVALASDLRIGTIDCTIAFLFVRVGLAGADMGACNLLPRVIGAGRAAELLYTGRSMKGEEAERWGFLNRIVSSEKLGEEAEVLARQLAYGPNFAHAMTKTCLHQEWEMGIDAAIEAEAQAQAICMQTEDFARAYHAFVAREKPVFEGN